MAKKKTNNPSGFDDLLNGIYNNPMNTENVSNLDTDIIDDPDEDDIDKKDEITPVDTPTEDDADDTIVVGNDDSDIPDNIKNDQDDSDDEHEEELIEEDLTNEDVTEAQLVSALFEAVGESLGWNMADIDEKDVPLTVDDLTNYLSNVVKQNSIPQYADERIQQLDEYVKNGGKFEEFYSVQQEALGIDNIDLEDESNQKAVVRELLKHNGYSDEQINNKIARYEDNDMLFEESEDALLHLKTIRQAEAEQAAKEQEEYAKQQEEQQRLFFTSVTNDINSLNSIRGINVPKEDRKALYDYIFKVDLSGMSQYQKDFNENLSKNLIESAYFTMKGDTLIKGAAKTGETSATEKLRKLLRHLTKNHSAYNTLDKHKSATDLISGMF